MKLADARDQLAACRGLPARLQGPPARAGRWTSRFPGQGTGSPGEAPGETKTPGCFRPTRLVQRRVEQELGRGDAEAAAVKLLASAGDPLAPILALDVVALWPAACDCLAQALPDRHVELMAALSAGGSAAGVQGACDQARPGRFWQGTIRHACAGHPVGPDSLRHGASVALGRCSGGGLGPGPASDTVDSCPVASGPDQARRHRPPAKAPIRSPWTPAACWAPAGVSAFELARRTSTAGWRRRCVRSFPDWTTSAGAVREDLGRILRGTIPRTTERPEGPALG